MWYQRYNGFGMSCDLKRSRDQRLCDFMDRSTSV